MEKEEINTENTQQNKAICYVCGIKLPKKEMVNYGTDYKFWNVVLFQQLFLRYLQLSYTVL